MLDVSKKFLRQNSSTLPRDQIKINKEGQYTEEQLSSEEIKELIFNLISPELYAESAKMLIDYFSNNRYTYDEIYIRVLFEYFLEENYQSDEMISTVSDILNSIFSYNEQNYSILETMKDKEFYSRVFLYIDRIPSVMTLYKWLIKTFPNVYEYAMNNDICSKLSMIIFPENENTPILFELISSFSHYKEDYSKFTHLINAVCEITFSTTEFDIFKAGILCLSEFTYRSIDIAIEIFKNPKFYEFCSNLDQGRNFTFEAIVELLDRTLQNRELFYKSQALRNGITPFLILFSEETDLSEEFHQCMLNIIKAANIIIEQIRSHNCKESFMLPAVKALSMLIYGPEMVKFYMGSNIHILLFEIAQDDTITFAIHVEAFHAIMNLICSSYYNETKILMEMGFISLVENQIEIMLKLPNTTIDALMKIVNFSEKCEEAKYWGNMIFDNDTIVSQLQYVADHPDLVDEDNYAQDSVHNASALLERRPSC